MPALYSAAEFEQRVNQLSERLDALRGSPRTVAGPGPSLPYAGLDLTSVLPELADLLKALSHQEPDEPITHNARIEVGGRRLALAALMALVKGGEGLADFPARYEAALGEPVDYAKLEKFLPAAMREAGLTMPPKADGKRLIETLFAAGGLPAALIMSVARYFVPYWRFFHPQSSPLAPLSALAASGDAAWGGLDDALRAELKQLSERLLPNASVVGTVLEGLTAVFVYLRTQPKWRAGDLFSQAAEIRRQCGIDPKELLQGDEEALALLASELGHAWHPEQFRHALTALPRGGEVRLPSGALAMVEKAVAIPQWGVYRLEGKQYLVLPNEGLTVDAIKAMPQDTLWAVGNRAIYKSDVDAPVFADNWPQLRPAQPLYEERHQVVAAFYFQVPPNARTLTIGKHTLQPRPGVHWRLSLIATVDEADAPLLSVRVGGLRVCLPEFAGRSLQLDLPEADTQERQVFELDERGVGGLPDLLLSLPSPVAGELVARLLDAENGEPIAFDGEEIRYVLPLPEVMLFAEATGAAVPPEGYPYGLPSYLMLATRPINADSLEMLDIGVKALGGLGDYQAHRLNWNDPHQAMAIFLDAQFHWNFTYRVESVWQAGELPLPVAPYAFAPETPVGYTVSTADDLFVDDVSLVEEPLVTLTMGGVQLAANTWSELNWMMNFPVDNRRFSGVMMRRMLHVDADFDLAGVYTLALKAGGETLGERRLTILPKLDVRVTPTGRQPEGTSYQLKVQGELPCFLGGERTLSFDLGTPVVDDEVMETAPFLPKPVEATLQLQVPYFDLPIALYADLYGYRLLDDNEGTWSQASSIAHAALGHTTLVAFAAHGERAQLVVKGGETLEEEFYEGFSTFSLGALQESIRKHRTALSLRLDGKEVAAFDVVWTPQVLHFEAVNEYLEDYVASLEIQIEGPEDAPVHLEAYSPDGRKIGSTDVRAEGGTLQTITFNLMASRDYPSITVRPVLPDGSTAGELTFRNVAFEPELEEINRRIAADPHAADLRYERAQLLLARGLRKAAGRDIQGAVDLGMTELVNTPEYQQHQSQRRADGFHEEIKALASFFVPFARKELNIG